MFAACVMTWKVLSCQIGVHSDTEDFCRNRFENDHREGGEVFTSNDKRSAGSTYVVEAVHLLQHGALLQLLECVQTEGTLWVLCSFSEKTI